VADLVGDQHFVLGANAVNDWRAFSRTFE